MNIRRLTCVCAAAATMAMTAVASTPNLSKTEIPFEFVANGKTMPAGHYTLAKNSENSLQVRSDKGDAALSLVTRNVGSSSGVARPRLVFVKKDGRMHLSEIYVGSDATGAELPVK